MVTVIWSIVVMDSGVTFTLRFCVKESYCQPISPALVPEIEVPESGAFRVIGASMIAEIANMAAILIVLLIFI